MAATGSGYSPMVAVMNAAIAPVAAMAGTETEAGERPPLAIEGAGRVTAAPTPTMRAEIDARAALSPVVAPIAGIETETLCVRAIAIPGAGRATAAPTATMLAPIEARAALSPTAAPTGGTLTEADMGTTMLGADNVEAAVIAGCATATVPCSEIAGAGSAEAAPITGTDTEQAVHQTRSEQATRK